MAPGNGKEPFESETVPNKLPVCENKCDVTRHTDSIIVFNRMA